MKENFSITKKGKALAKSKYTIDVKGKTFSSRESNLVLDFNGLHDWTFKTGDFCTFKTGKDCTFLIWNISTQTFKLSSRGVIIDSNGSQHYLLNEEFIMMQKVLRS